jgi:serine/threonine protein kinase
MGKIIENYSLQEVLGQGVYGKVYKAVNLLTKQ